MFQHILFPSDLSAATEPAFESLLALAQPIQARVTLFHACPSSLQFYAPEMAASVAEVFSQLELELEERAWQDLNKYKKRLDAARLIGEAVVVHGHPGHQIVHTASCRGCDLILLPSRGLGTVQALLLGSTSSYVLHHSHCPVMILPGGRS